MKKTLVIFLTALICVSAAGCGEDESSSSAVALKTAVTDSVKEDTPVLEADASEENEAEETSAEDTADKQEQTESSTEKEEETVAETEAETEAVTETPQPEEETEVAEENEKPQEQSGGETSQDEEADPLSIAEMYYNDACTMYHTVLLCCPYTLDYDSITDDGWAPVNDPTCTDGIKSIEDYYCNLFTEPDELIYERYKEIDGKLYCNDTARGTNIYYAGTSFELLENDGETLVFNAISHYEFEETGEKLEDETEIFTVVKWEDGYKVSEFTFPM